jgi:hypothetical protein
LYDAAVIVTMKTYKFMLISAALATALAACAPASPAPQQAAPVAVLPDAAATKDAMAKEEAMKKAEMLKAEAEATKEAMAKEDAMKKEEMVKAEAEATKEAMAKEEAMKKEEMLKAEAEATKEAMAKEEAMKKEEAVAGAGAMMIGKGAFTKVDATHFASGQASIDKTADGKFVVRFADFSAADGPDLYVMLSAHPDPRSSEEVMKDGSLELGQLSSQSGDQEYALPADYDPAKYKSIVIYCKRFGVVFSTATLN